MFKEKRIKKEIEEEYGDKVNDLIVDDTLVLIKNKKDVETYLKVLHEITGRVWFARYTPYTWKTDKMSELKVDYVAYAVLNEELNIKFDELFEAEKIAVGKKEYVTKSSFYRIIACASMLFEEHNALFWENVKLKTDVKKLEGKLDKYKKSNINNKSSKEKSANSVKTADKYKLQAKKVEGKGKPKLYKSVKEASQDLNIATDYIYKVLNGKLKQSKGYTFSRIK